MYSVSARPTLRDQPACDQPACDQPACDHPACDHPACDHPKPTEESVMPRTSGGGWPPDDEPWHRLIEFPVKRRWKCGIAPEHSHCRPHDRHFERRSGDAPPHRAAHLGPWSEPSRCRRVAMFSGLLVALPRDSGVAGSSAAGGTSISGPGSTAGWRLSRFFLRWPWSSGFSPPWVRSGRASRGCAWLRSRGLMPEGYAVASPRAWRARDGQGGLLDSPYPVCIHPMHRGGS